MAGFSRSKQMTSGSSESLIAEENIGETRRRGVGLGIEGRSVVRMYNRAIVASIVPE